VTGKTPTDDVMKPRLGLHPEQFAAAFPFHLVFGEDGRIVQVGAVLQRICPLLQPGAAIADIVTIVRPKATPFTLDRLVTLQSSLFILNVEGGRVTLRGQMCVDPAARTGFFLGSPWLTRFDEVAALGLSLSDFANHDSIGEFLILFQAKHAALRTAEALSERLEAQRHLLKETNDRLEQQMVERARADSALRVSEALYHSMVDTVKDVIFQIDAVSSTWSLLNPAWTEITGFTAGQSIGQPVLAFVHPGHERMARDWIARLASGADAVLRQVVRFRTREGASRDISMFARSVRGLDDAVRTIAGTGADMTAQVEQERTLRAANHELSKAMRLKDEFLSGMSHELRTPLNAILGLSESLMEDIYGAISEEQRTVIGHVESSGRHLLSLINEILDFSKIEAGQVTLDLKDVAVAGVCRASMTAVAAMVEKKRLALTLTLGPDVSTVQADERRLRQILLNLLGNAVKFTPEGGAVSIDVTSDPAAQTVVIAVSDTGVGMSPEDIKRLFQPFSQLDAGLARRFGGTGLGLAITKRLTELHHGTVGVESELEKGSRFRVTLPWTAIVAPATDPAVTRRESVRSSHPLVLLVDDGESNRLVMGSYLRTQHFDVATASSADEGVRLARDLRPDLIFMDVEMPGMSGHEAMRTLREDPAFGATPIIGLLTTAAPAEREACLAAGANDCLSKPVQLRALVENARVHLQTAVRPVHA
jgi:PAS domain S-box-containing protein